MNISLHEFSNKIAQNLKKYNLELSEMVYFSTTKVNPLVAFVYDKLLDKTEAEAQALIDKTFGIDFVDGFLIAWDFKTGLGQRYVTADSFFHGIHFCFDWMKRETFV